MIGCDYIARRHVNATSLDASLETDEEEDPPKPPSELSRMQTRFRELTTRTGTPREALLTTILGRSILEPSQKTFYDPAAEQFVIADLRPTRGELERWNSVTV